MCTHTHCWNRLVFTQCYNSTGQDWRHNSDRFRVLRGHILEAILHLNSVLWGIQHTLIHTVCESKYVRSHKNVCSRLIYGNRGFDSHDSNISIFVTCLNFPSTGCDLYAISHTLIHTHTVFIKVCDTPHKTEFRCKIASKICPLKLKIYLNYAFSLYLCCYNIVWTPTCFNGVCMYG